MMDETTFAGLDRALAILVKAGRNDDFSEGSADPHLAHESYIEALWRFRTITERLETSEEPAHTESD